MHPLLTVFARSHCRRELRAKGYSARQISDVIHAVDDDSIHWAASEAKATAEVGAIGDGTILQAIIDFLKSPQGQELIAALVKMLIALLDGL